MSPQFLPNLVTEQAKAFKFNTVSRKGVGGVSILLGMLDAKETGHHRVWPYGPLACVHLYLHTRKKY